MTSFIAVWAAAQCAVFSAATEPMAVWLVDPLVKVFADARPDGAPAAPMEAARGEQATFQVVIRAEQPLREVRVAVDALATESGAALTARAPRAVGYVFVDRPTQKPSKDQLRRPPADYPDVLLETDTVGLGAGESRPVWVTVDVPMDAAPGIYRGMARVSALTEAGGLNAAVPLELEVFAAAAGPSRLWMTNWFSIQWSHMEISPEPDSEEYYALMRRFARNMAEHRQNVALISPLSLANFGVDASGGLTVDFARFDKWVRIFKEEGVIGRIEGGHFGGRAGDWNSTFVASVRSVENGAVKASSAAPDSPEAEAFYAWFLPQLTAHLKGQGWMDCYLQHLADEPTESNRASYRALADLVRRHAPELKIVEACHDKDLVGAIDVWVPQLNYLHDSFDHYQARQAAGDEVWLYTCVFPQGEYANRFIEQPLLKTRILHWINYRYGVTGYLHWGYNHWTADDPMTHTTRAHGGPPYLPAGDPWIVYPGKNGPLDSIRHEAMRDGIADYELLAQLGEKDPDAARELAARIVKDFDQYESDVAAFRAARRELLERLSR